MKDDNECERGTEESSGITGFQLENNIHLEVCAEHKVTYLFYHF